MSGQNTATPAMSGMLKDRVAIVTGGAQGIGRATVLTLAGHGAKVVVADLDGNRVKALVAEVGEDEAVGFVGDITAAGAPEALVGQAIEAFGQLDIVVNNAGYNWDGLLHTMSDEQFQTQLDIHLIAPFRILRAAAPHLREPAKAEAAQGIERFRKVVNVSSVAAALGQVGAGNYAAAKAGLIGLTRTLANEWGPLKINVNAVAFGGISTRLAAPAQSGAHVQVGDRQVQVGLAAGAARSLGMEPGQDMTEEELCAPRPMPVPLGRTGVAQEAANSIFYLCSPLSDYVHGHVHVVSGGMGYGLM